MKHYLLTWYGITDLRAALGFERGDGPVFGALRSGGFSDVVILAYGKPGKATDAHLANEVPALSDAPPQRQAEVVDAFANSAEGHRMFDEWLKRRLLETGLNVRVRMCPVELAELNDTRGIQDAANRALEATAAEPGEKAITFYISPGTPVMAFTWAFVALTNPELDIRILARSQPGKPPEFVDLPYELMAPSNRKLRILSGDPETEFDVVFHLMGEQRMPALLGVREFKAKRHVFVTSGDYSSEVMKRFVPAGSWSEIHVNAFDPMAVKMALLKEAAAIPSGSKVGFNLTGGTKLMFAGAIAACRKIGGVPFYFETSQHRLIFLHDYTQRVPRGVDSCESFLFLNGFDVLTSGRWEDNPNRERRVQMTQLLWRNQNLMKRLWIGWKPRFSQSQKSTTFALRHPGGKRGDTVSIICEELGTVLLRVGQYEFRFPSRADFLQYISGGWFEEFVFIQLRGLIRSGYLRDIRIGVKVTQGDRKSSGALPDADQEFDGLLTDGKRLILIECKAAKATVEQMFKLQQLARNYGGHEAHGLLVSTSAPSDSLRKRILAARNIHGIFGRDVDHDLAALVLRILNS